MFFARAKNLLYRLDTERQWNCDTWVVICRFPTGETGAQSLGKALPVFVESNVTSGALFQTILDQTLANDESCTSYLISST